MSSNPILHALSSRRIAALISQAANRIIYAAPGVQTDAANAIVSQVERVQDLAVTVSLDFSEQTLRMGYGTLDGVDFLRKAKIEPTHSPGLRCGILIIDGRGWVFTPTALYLEAEPQSDETPNAVELSQTQVQTLAIRLSPAAKKLAIKEAETPEKAAEVSSINLELGIAPVTQEQMVTVKKSIDTAPPVKFDVVRQVRVFEPYLQYVELSLTGAAVQRHRVRIPSELLNLGASEDLQGKLKTTLDLIEKDSSLSSKPLEDELNKIRKNLTRSLGKNHGRVVLKSAKPRLQERLDKLRKDLEGYQEKVEEELQAKLDESKEQVLKYYLPLVRENPPDELLGSHVNITDDTITKWVKAKLSSVFPSAESLIQKMMLEDGYKDVTFETLNRPDFHETVKAAFPGIDWEKPFHEFKAAGESKDRD